MSNERLTRMKAAIKYDCCFPLTEAGIRYLLKDYYDQSFIIFSSSVHNSEGNYRLYEALEKDINSLNLKYLPFRDTITKMISVLVFPFDSKGHPVDMYKVIQNFIDWSTSYSQKKIMIKDKNGYVYCIDNDTQEVIYMEYKVNQSVIDYINFYLDKLLPETEHSIFTIAQPGSPFFAAYPRTLKGEFCMPLDTWRNSYGKLYS